MSGDRATQKQTDLFEKHSALFIDKENDDGVFPRLQNGRDEKVVHEAYEQFYDNTACYDLTGQWIRESGPFRYDLSWLSPSAAESDVENYMRGAFQSAFDVDPADADIIVE